MPLIHLVSKQVHSNHHVVEYEGSPPLQLPKSSVRVRTAAVTLSANNLSYARGGYRLHWWDAYPVPSDLPAPYNDSDKWGIVPAWGRAEVLESNVGGLKPGDILWGLHSISTQSRIMELEPMGPRGMWKECSRNRSVLYELYNTVRLELLDPPPGVHSEAWLGLRIACEGPWLLYNYVFSSDPFKRFHPLGTDAKWTEQDADLSQSVLISLSAGGKTARAFAWCVQQERDGNVPLGLLQVTTTPKNLRPVDKEALPAKSVDYTALFSDDTFEWIKNLNPARVVIFDFGAKDDVLLQVYSKAISLHLDPMVVGIGSQAKVSTDDEQAQSMKIFQTVSKRQLNTAAARSAAIAKEGAAAYYARFDAVNNKLLAEDGLGELKVDRRDGVEGISSAWEDLCDGKASATSYINVYM